MAANTNGTPWHCAVHNLGILRKLLIYGDKIISKIYRNSENKYIYLCYEAVRVQSVWVSNSKI